MIKTIGFIGCGNMAKAMIKGIVDSGLYEAKNIYAADPNSKNLTEVRNNYNIQVAQNNCSISEVSDIIILSVKPNIYPQVISEIKNFIKKNVIIICIGAGEKISSNETRFDRLIKLVRVMPNTPALVGAGMSAISFNDQINASEMEEVVELFSCFGKAEIIDEKLMDAVTAVSGSGPAYVFMFIEALADGAVLEGIPRDQAYLFAAQTVLGSAKMVLDTGLHPGVLKDMVCSPGGTTIEAVSSLEKNHLRSSLIEAVRTCAEKSKNLGK